MRPSGRALEQMRPISIETNVTKHAEGSCLIKVGDTQVICTATLEERVPPFVKGLGLVGSQRNMECFPGRPDLGCGARQLPENRADEQLKSSG